MQLKLQRTQRMGGAMGGTVVFCLDARVSLTQPELKDVQRYKLHNQVIYNSEASRKHIEKGMSQNDGSILGSFKGLASLAMAHLNLNITISSLQKGQHIECKSLDELLGAEEALMVACNNLRGYLDTAATFDGTEVVINFDSAGPAVITQATPQPALVAPNAPAPPAAFTSTQEYVAQPATNQFSDEIAYGDADSDSLTLNASDAGTIKMILAIAFATALLFLLIKCAG